MIASINSILIKGGRVYDHQANSDQPQTADILISGDRITDIGPNLDLGSYPNTRIIDAGNNLVMPGFVNAHYHSHDVLWCDS